MRTEIKTTTTYTASDGKEFDREADCKAYEASLAHDLWMAGIDNALAFTVEADHLALLRRLNFDLYPREWMIAVDPKRPFGNSDIERDVAEIIGLELFVDADGRTRRTAEQERLCIQRYFEMKNFLDILCTIGAIPSGSYRRLATYESWYPLATGVTEIDASIWPDDRGKGDIAYSVDGGEPVQYCEVFDRARNAEDSLWGRMFQMEWEAVEC